MSATKGKKRKKVPNQWYYNSAIKKKAARELIDLTSKKGPSLAEQLTPARDDRPREEEEEEEEEITGGLSRKQREIVRSVLVDGKNVFFTGSAGTGKSYTLRHIVKQFHDRDDVHVTASTGTAAINIGGCTLHSFAGIGLGKETVDILYENIMTKFYLRAAKSRWQTATVLIIDEVSMIDAVLFDKIEQIGRRIRGDAKPFGGLQVVLCGDFLQLPPVTRGGEKKKEPMFRAECWNELIDETFVLEKIFRQCGDREFATMLNNIRFGRVSGETTRLLDPCRIPFEERPADERQETLGILPTMLYGHNKDVSTENEKKLAEINEPLKVFRAFDAGDKKLKEKLARQCIVPTVLRLKVGAQVVLLKNLNVAAGLANGSRGVVTGFVRSDWVPKRYKGAKKPPLQPDRPINPLAPVVRFTNGHLCELTQEMWEIKEDPREAARSQIPLMLAWALTIHKVQGMTLTKAKMDLSRVWECGQAYVALSRVTDRRGLHLIDYNLSNIRADPVAREFHESLSTES